jgi:hypothetical protein
VKSDRHAKNSPTYQTVRTIGRFGEGIAELNGVGFKA